MAPIFHKEIYHNEPQQVIEKFKVEATPSKIETQSNGYLLVRQFDWSEK